MKLDPRVEDLFARFVEHHVTHGQVLSAKELCQGDADLLAPLGRIEGGCAEVLRLQLAQARCWTDTRIWL